MTETAHDNICPLFRTGDVLAPLLTIKQAAEYLQSSTAYVYKLIDGGRMKALELPIESKNGNPVTRRVLRIRTADLQEFMEGLPVVNGDRE